MSFLFPEPEKDPTYRLLEALLQNQRLQLDILAEQQRTFAQWLEMFKAPTVGKIEEVNPRTEDDLIEQLELAAELGNDEAKQIIANEDSLREYIRYYRSAT